jgi:uncharacterized protein (DUF1810 family)
VSPADPYNLQRFIAAQNPVFDAVREELRRGRKRSHWMWFVFPQLKGLGYSSMAQTYAISSKAEAEAYLAHPILGPRLTECAQLALAVEDRSAEEIFGDIDEMKFRSSMTLFAQVAPNSVFDEALRRFFGGVPDQISLDLL